MSKRILFVLASPEYLRYFDTTMALLAERGHAVSVGVNWLRERKHARLDELITDPRIEIVGQVPGRGDLWVHWARAVRGTFDFVRYLHPSLAGAVSLRERARRKAAPRAARVLDRLRQLSPSALERFYAVLRLCESAVPVSRTIERFLRERRPDLVVVSPLIDLNSNQVDMVRAARALGIPTAVAVASWDNLTNKGHLRVVPDAVIVWNDRQVEEAVTLHGVPRERLIVTGAQLFDRWFERRPSQSREAYCRMVGLPDARPFVLYTGSSVFIARSELEVPFVRAWLTALRTSGPQHLRDAHVLIRPHPFNSAAWEDADFDDLGPVSIWPRARYTPASETSRDAFYDSLYYCAAVVGINTSAMIEAAILGKPVLSFLTPEFAGTQEGTLHFKYLLPENGGFLRVASSIDVHLEQLAGVLADQEASRAELARFVRTFIRPRGLDTSATPVVADALVSTANPVAAAREGLGARLARLIVLPIAATMAALLPPITSEGRTTDGWFRRVQPLQRTRKWTVKQLRRVAGLRRDPVKRLRKHLIERPVRWAVRATRVVRTHAVNRARQSRRWFRWALAALVPSDGRDKS